MEDGLAAMSTALKPGKFLPKISKRGEIAPLTRAEVALMIGTAKTKLPSYYPLFLCAVRSGSRMGELLALQWGDISWQGRFIEVQRNYTHWQLTTPKGGENRRVDMSRELGEVLKDWQTEHRLRPRCADGGNLRRGCSPAKLAACYIPTTYATASSTGF